MERLFRWSLAAEWSVMWLAPPCIPLLSAHSAILQYTAYMCIHVQYIVRALSVHVQYSRHALGTRPDSLCLRSQAELCIMH